MTDLPGPGPALEMGWLMGKLAGCCGVALGFWGFWGAVGFGVSVWGVVFWEQCG